MRLRSLIPVLTVLATAGCDSTGALKLAQAPAPKPADCCCKPAATPATCPPVAAPTPIAAQPAAMTPELEQPAYRPAVHRQTASSAARRVTHVQRRPTARHVERDYGEVGEYGEARAYGYAQQRAYAAAPATASSPGPARFRRAPEAGLTLALTKPRCPALGRPGDQDAIAERAALQRL